MSVPETTIHQYDSAEAGKYQVRSSGQFRGVETEPEPRPVQTATQKQFRFSVATPDAAHIVPALFGCKDVHIRPSHLLHRRQ